MRIFLIFIAILMTQSAVAAVNWIDIAKLPNVREASKSEIADFRKTYGKSSGEYNLTQDDVRILVHEGDLTVNQSVASGDIVVVKGDLKINGNYHDYMGGGIGVLFVDGSMEVDNLYSWGALYVAKDLHARGVVLTVYNDFTFEVMGHVIASAVIVSDKSSDFKVQGKVAQIGEHASADGYALALRVLRPELFANTARFKFEYDRSGLRFDDQMGQKYIRTGQSLLRDKPAAPTLTAQLKQAVAAKTSVATLKTLIGQDPLLAQVIAARPDNNIELFDLLFATNDTVVREWLAAVHPIRLLSRINDREITGPIARQLVKTAIADPTTARFAKSKDPAVRAALAQVKTLDRQWVNALANDRDESVRYEIILNHAPRLASSTIEKRLTDVPKVLGALVLAPLTADQLNQVLPKLDQGSVAPLAHRLKDWRLGDAATPLSSAEIDHLALRLLADRRNVVGRNEAFLALSGKAQVANFDKQISDRKIRIGSIARSTHSVAVLEKVIAHCDHHRVNLPEDIARNPRLTPAMQRLIFDRGVQAAREARDKRANALFRKLIFNRGMLADPKIDVRDDPAQTLEGLLREEHVSPEIIELALAELLKNAHFVTPLSHYKSYSPAQIRRLSKYFRGSEDWASSLLLQPRIQADELLPILASLARRYHNPDVQLELKPMTSLQGDALFVALAQAKFAGLREVAARNVATPVEVLTRLTKDPVRDVALTAKRNPKLPVDLRMQFALELDDNDAIKHLARTQPEELSSFLAKLADEHPTRLIAEQEIRKLKAMVGEQ